MCSITDVVSKNLGPSFTRYYSKVYWLLKNLVTALPAKASSLWQISSIYYVPYEISLQQFTFQFCVFKSVFFSTPPSVQPAKMWFFFFFFALMNVDALSRIKCSLFPALLNVKISHFKNHLYTPNYENDSSTDAAPFSQL